MLHRDAWLAEILERDVYRMDLAPGEAAGLLGSAEFRAAAAVPGTFLYARVAPDDGANLAALEAAGFFLADTNLVFAGDVRGLGAAGPAPAVRPARPGDAAVVTELAAGGFTCTRFHRDPRIGQKLADRIEAAWAANYFRGQRGDAMYVAELGGSIAGMLLVLHQDADLVVDLIAVDASHRKAGLGRAMLRLATACRPEAARLRAGTQLANALSIRFYQGLGMNVVAGEYILHYHAKAAAPREHGGAGFDTQTGDK